MIQPHPAQEVTMDAPVIGPIASATDETEGRMAFIARIADVSIEDVRISFKDAVESKMTDMNDEAYKSAKDADEAHYQSKSAAVIWGCAFTLSGAAGLPAAVTLGLFLVCGVWAAGLWSKARDERDRARRIIEAGVEHHEFRQGLKADPKP